MTTKKPSRVMLKVIKGGFQPADQYSAEALRAKGYRVGDIVAGEIKKPRNPGFHRLAHQIGSLIAGNIEAFSGMQAHQVLKRIQIEANIACDEVALNFPGIGPCTYRVPQSLSFESMEDGTFHETITEICAYVAKRYWPEVDPEKIEQMAEAWVSAA